MYTDLRKGRRSEVERIYHVTATTLDRRHFFADLARGRMVVQEIARLSTEERTDTLCFVVMPDHLHWLFSLRAGSLPEAMQRLKGRSAHRAGMRLWQASYFDHALRRDEDVRGIARYIIANPLRAGLVSAIGDYPLWDAQWLDARGDPGL